MTLEKDKVYSTQEASELLGVHPNSLTNWYKAGLVERRTIGRRCFFLGSDLLKALEAESVSAK